MVNGVRPASPRVLAVLRVPRTQLEELMSASRRSVPCLFPVAEQEAQPGFTPASALMGGALKKGAGGPVVAVFS